MTITQGGIYSGLNVTGTVSTPAITIKTSEPVTIEDSAIFFPGCGIESDYNNAQVTVSQCFFYGQNPNVAGVFTGSAICSGTPNGTGGSLTVTQCTIMDSGSVAIYVNSAPVGENITIDNNWIIDLQGSPSDGNGGWNTALWEDGRTTHAVQIAKANLVTCQVEWNLVQNTPFASSCDDVFNFYNSSGTGSDNPILCEDNFVDGLYPAIPGSQADAGAAFTTDGGTVEATECAYITFNKDYAVHIGTKGFQLPMGHDILMENCYTYDPGYTTDSSATPCYGINIGICGFNEASSANFYNNQINNCSSYLLRPPDSIQNSRRIGIFCPILALQ